MHHLCISIGMCVHRYLEARREGVRTLELELWGSLRLLGCLYSTIGYLFIRQPLQSCLEISWVHRGCEREKFKKHWSRALKCIGNCFLHWVAINNPAYIICTAHSRNPRRQFPARLPIPISQNSQRSVKWILHVYVRWWCFFKQMTLQGNSKNHFLLLSYSYWFFLNFLLVRNSSGLGAGEVAQQVRALLHKHGGLNSNLHHPHNKLDMTCMYICNSSTGQGNARRIIGTHWSSA